MSLYLTLPGVALGDADGGEEHRFLKVRDQVGDPENVFFEVQYSGKTPIRLAGHFWCDGSDDRWNDDVHYMGGSMMFDNVSWPSSMFGWLAAAPDPAVVGDAWQEMWRSRIENADFWFRQWGGHQPRDDYWRTASVHDRYANVGVPVFIMSGWQDGYKNPVAHVISGLAALGKETAGLIGAWGHKYPFNGYPGPRVDWLAYIVTHWWDRWLKGTTPPAEDTWPQLTAWLGSSKEPNRSACADDGGRWIAEDGAWQTRVTPKVLYLGPGNRLGDAPERATYASSGQPVLDTEMLETSSWGECGNDDLPGDQARFDRESLYFDSEPLPAELDCFGYPEVQLTLKLDRPIAALAIRLCEISPETGASHLVTYRFFNPAYRGGDMAKPQAIEPGETRHADPQGLRQRPLSIWRPASGPLGRSGRRREFPDGDRRPALACGLHSIDHNPRTP